MATSKAMRDRIDQLIDLYLNWLVQHNDAAGWHQPNVLQVWRDHRGFIPERSGMDRSNDKMIAEIRHVRREHALLPRARWLFGRPEHCTHCSRAQPERDDEGAFRLHAPEICPHCENLTFTLHNSRLTPRYAIPLLASRHYRGWTHEQIALRLRMSAKTYEGRLNRAREIAALELLALDDYEAMVAVVTPRARRYDTQREDS